jgi:hypothetical protein
LPPTHPYHLVMVHNRYDCHLLRIKPRLHSQSCQRNVIGGASAQ